MSELERRAVLGAAGLAGIAVLASRAAAGPLNPPAGSVSSTGRTLDEIYNRIPAASTAIGLTAIPGGTSGATITQPGSYILTGNLFGSGAAVITISASDVSLNLNGYTVTSSSTAASSRVIFISGVRSRVTIRNGRVVGAEFGLGLTAASTDLLIEDLWVHNSKFTGIATNFAGSTRTIVRRCTVTGVGAVAAAAETISLITGITVSGANCRIEDCNVGGFDWNGSGTPFYRGIVMSSGGGVGNLITRCCVSNEVSLTGEGLRFFGTGIYRDNTVMSFSTAFSSGTNGGGNTSL